MRKILFFIFFATFLILSFISCGAVIDDLRISGVWDLYYVEFYSYNELLDATKIYNGIDDNTPDTRHPLNSSFFNEKGNFSYSIEFDRSNTFKIMKDETGDYVTSPYTKWSIDSFNNTLSLTVYDNSSDTTLESKGFWKSGFEITNSWPMPNYQTLEITIRASDVGKKEFLIDLSDRVLNVKMMKAVFLRP